MMNIAGRDRKFV